MHYLSNRTFRAIILAYWYIISHRIRSKFRINLNNFYDFYDSEYSILKIDSLFVFMIYHRVAKCVKRILLKTIAIICLSGMHIIVSRFSLIV
jgi:hypothetical protein